MAKREDTHVEPVRIECFVRSVWHCSLGEVVAVRLRVCMSLQYENTEWMSNLWIYDCRLPNWHVTGKFPGFHFTKYRLATVFALFFDWHDSNGHSICRSIDVRSFDRFTAEHRTIDEKKIICVFLLKNPLFPRRQQYLSHFSHSHVSVSMAMM